MPPRSRTSAQRVNETVGVLDAQRRDHVMVDRFFEPIGTIEQNIKEEQRWFGVHNRGEKNALSNSPLSNPNRLSIIDKDFAGSPSSETHDAVFNRPLQ